MDKEGLTRVFSDEGYVSKKMVPRYAYDFEKIKVILSPLGKWEEILKLDETRLRRVLGEIPEEARLAIENARNVAREYTVLTSSMRPKAPGN